MIFFQNIMNSDISISGILLILYSLILGVIGKLVYSKLKLPYCVLLMILGVIGSLFRELLWDLSESIF